MTAHHDFQEVTVKLELDKTKARSEGVTRCRAVLSSNRNLHGLDQDPRHTWIQALQTMFSVVIKERNTLVQKKSAATEKRLEEATQMVRVGRRQAHKIVPRKAAKAIIADLTQLTTVAGKLQPLALTYVKALRAVLSYSPHLWHLDERAWTDIAMLCFSAVIRDKIRIGQDFVDDTVLDIDEDGVGPTMTRDERRRRSRDADEDGTDRDRGRDRMHGPIFRKFLRFFRLVPGETRAILSAVTAPNRAFAEVDLNDQQSMKQIGRHVWPHVLALWATTNASLKEQLVVALRYLFPFVVPVHAHAKHESERAVLAWAKELYDAVLTEPTILWREAFDVDIDHRKLGHRPADESTTAPYHAVTFRIGIGADFDERDAIACSVVELGADALARIYEQTVLPAGRMGEIHLFAQALRLKPRNHRLRKNDHLRGFLYREKKRRTRDLTNKRKLEATEATARQWERFDSDLGCDLNGQSISKPAKQDPPSTTSPGHSPASSKSRLNAVNRQVIFRLYGVIPLFLRYKRTVVAINVLKSDTTFSLSSSLAEQLAVPVSEIRLRHRGSEVPPHATFGKIASGRSITLEVLFRLHGGVGTRRSTRLVDGWKICCLGLTHIYQQPSKAAGPHGYMTLQGEIECTYTERIAADPPPPSRSFRLRYLVRRDCTISQAMEEEQHLRLINAAAERVAARLDKLADAGVVRTELIAEGVRLEPLGTHVDKIELPGIQYFYKNGKPDLVLDVTQEHRMRRFQAGDFHPANSTYFADLDLRHEDTLKQLQSQAVPPKQLERWNATSEIVKTDDACMYTILKLLLVVLCDAWVSVAKSEYGLRHFWTRGTSDVVVPSQHADRLQLDALIQPAGCELQVRRVVFSSSVAAVNGIPANEFLDIAMAVLDGAKSLVRSLNQNQSSVLMDDFVAALRSLGPALKKPYRDSGPRQKDVLWVAERAIMHRIHTATHNRGPASELSQLDRISLAGRLFSRTATEEGPYHVLRSEMFGGVVGIFERRVVTRHEYYAEYHQENMCLSLDHKFQNVPTLVNGQYVPRWNIQSNFRIVSRDENFLKSREVPAQAPVSLPAAANMQSTFADIRLQFNDHAQHASVLNSIALVILMTYRAWDMVCPLFDRFATPLHAAYNSRRSLENVLAVLKGDFARPTTKLLARSADTYSDRVARALGMEEEEELDPLGRHAIDHALTRGLVSARQLRNRFMEPRTPSLEYERMHPSVIGQVKLVGEKIFDDVLFLRQDLSYSTWDAGRATFSWDAWGVNVFMRGHRHEGLEQVGTMCSNVKEHFAGPAQETATQLGLVPFDPDRAQRTVLEVAEQLEIDNPGILSEPKIGQPLRQILNLNPKLLGRFSGLLPSLG
ncbi:hypothetical protein JCM3774_005407 [Rhodotorula dairenensis]